MFTPFRECWAHIIWHESPYRVGMWGFTKQKCCARLEHTLNHWGNHMESIYIHSIYIYIYIYTHTYVYRHIHQPASRDNQVVQKDMAKVMRCLRPSCSFCSLIFMLLHQSLASFLVDNHTLLDTYINTYDTCIIMCIYIYYTCIYV